METIKITCITRTHSFEQFVEATLISLLHQSLSRDMYEILVIDDNANENVKEIINKYRDQVRIIETGGLGVYGAANVGFKEAKGKYVMLTDSDDFFGMNILKDMLGTIEDEDADMVYADYYELDEDTGKTKLISVKDNMFDNIATGILFKKETLEKLGYYDESLKLAEYDLYMKLKEYNCIYLNKQLHIYRRHHGSITTDDDNINVGMKQLYDKYGDELPEIRGY